MIQLTCPICTNRVRFKDDQAGTMARCPECGDSIRVPGTAVSVERPARSVPKSQDKKGRAPWGIIAAAAVILIVGGVVAVWFAFRSRPVKTIAQPVPETSRAAAQVLPPVTVPVQQSAPVSIAPPKPEPIAERPPVKPPAPPVPDAGEKERRERELERERERERKLAEERKRERDARIQRRVVLLTVGERFDYDAISKSMKAGSFDLTTDQFEMLASQRDLFDPETWRPYFLKVLKRSPFITGFVANMKIQDRKDLDDILIEFSALKGDDFIEAMHLSSRFSQGGLSSLYDEDKQFIRNHPRIFPQLN